MDFIKNVCMYFLETEFHVETSTPSVPGPSATEVSETTSASTCSEGEINIEEKCIGKRKF